MATNPKTVERTLVHPDCNKSTKFGQPISDTVDEKDAAKTKSKDDKGFLFDIIIVRLDIPNKTIDESSKLSVQTIFNGRDFSITASRINVLDFKPDRSIEFVAKPLDLKEQLSKSPLQLKVTDGDSVIGYGSLEWPKDFLSNLVECTGEMINTFEIELMKCDGTKTGTVHLIVRLQPKCEEYEEDITLDASCRNAHKEINPYDVLFVVGEDKKTANCCCSQIGIIPPSESDHDLQPKCLDLSNFRAINSQNVNNTDILSSLDPACQELKTISNHYQKLVDAVKNKRKQNLLIKESDSKTDKIEYAVPSDSSLEASVLPLNSDTYRMPMKYSSDSEAFVAKDMVQITHEGDPPELIENEPKSLRRCPLCKENLAYLPKLAACPNCCYKPIPYYKEKPYDVAQSGDQILKEYNELQTDDSAAGDASSNDESKNRCTCRYGSNKQCAHCRIRKLCEHVYEPSSLSAKPAKKFVPKSSDIDVHCVSSSENRPLLTRIFSELKDLYDIKKPKEEQFEIGEPHNRQLEEPVKKIDFPLKVETNLKTQKTDAADIEESRSKSRSHRKRRKHSIKPASKLVARSKLYDYQLVKENFGIHTGHKTCINGFAGRKNVPSNMGWLWSIHNSGNWKPGAIRKPIRELMSYFLKDFPADTLLVSQYSYRKMPKSRKMPGDTLVQKPTLHIRKKNGEYIITMRPLKAREFLNVTADPYENMKPVQFRIVKNPLLDAVRCLKKYLKSIGFKKCTCHRPISYCYCRSFVEKRKLEYQCNKECCRLQMEPCCDTLVLTDTSESEAEFDFGVTPPVGIIKPGKLKKPDLVNVGTQYEELDWNSMPLFPRPPNKYMQNYQCAIRGRKANAGTGTGVKISDSALGRKVAIRTDYVKKAERRIGHTKRFVDAKAGGDVFLMGKRSKGDAVAVDPGVKGATKMLKEKLEKSSKKKVNMLRYVMLMDKKMSKVDAAAKRKEKMNLLKGANPPILCMIDRRGKPASCSPCNDIRIC